MRFRYGAEIMISFVRCQLSIQHTKFKKLMHEQSKIISIHKNMIIRITIRNSRIIIDIVRIYYANAAACILLYFCILIEMIAKQQIGRQKKNVYGQITRDYFRQIVYGLANKTGFWIEI